MSLTQRRESRWVFKVYLGNDRSILSTPFETAANFFLDSIDFQYIKGKETHDRHLSIAELVAEFKSGDVCIFTGHPCFAVSYPWFSTWEMSTYHSHLSELRNTIGNVGGRKWECKVMQEDKYAYIEAMPDLFNPTLRLPLSADGQLTDELKIQLKRSANIHLCPYHQEFL